MNTVQRLTNRYPGVYRFFAVYFPLMFCGPIIAQACLQSIGLYQAQFEDGISVRVSNDSASAIAFIWVHCSFFINAGLIYAAEKCGRAFASKIPLIGAITIHALAIVFLNDPISTLTPYWSPQDATPQFVAQIHDLQTKTILALIVLHVLAATLIFWGPKPTTPESDSQTQEETPQ